MVWGKLLDQTFQRLLNRSNLTAKKGLALTPYLMQIYKYKGKLTEEEQIYYDEHMDMFKDREQLPGVEEDRLQKE